MLVPDTKPFFTTKRVLRGSLFALGFFLLALGALYTSNALVRVSQDSRTSIETETHIRLGEPYLHLGDFKPVQAIRADQQFYVHNKYIKTDTCSVQVSNVFWGVEKSFVHHYSTFANWFKAGTYEADELFIMPKLPSGRYRLVKKSISLCNGAEHYSTNFSVEVEVLPAAK